MKKKFLEFHYFSTDLSIHVPVLHCITCFKYLVGQFPELLPFLETSIFFLIYPRMNFLINSSSSRKKQLSDSYFSRFIEE